MMMPPNRCVLVSRPVEVVCAIAGSVVVKRVMRAVVVRQVMRPVVVRQTMGAVVRRAASDDCMRPRVASWPVASGASLVLQPQVEARLAVRVLKAAVPGVQLERLRRRG